MSNFTENKFYTLPLRLDEIIRKKQHQTCDLKVSIAQNLHLIISTYRGESVYAEDYGCSIWDEEFKNQLNIRWKEEVKQSILNAVKKFELRLLVTDIKVDLLEEEMRPAKNNLMVRRKLIVSVNGTIRKTNEVFTFQKKLFISPLSQT